jgi:hypothetical protein
VSFGTVWKPLKREIWWERGNSNPLPPASQPDFLISMNKALAHRDSGGGNQANRIFSVRERSGAARWGLVNTMVLTHLPSNILLSCPADAQSFAGGSGAPPTIQYQPNGCSHAAVLCHGGREQDERSAAAGITGVARTTGAAISTLFVGFMFARISWINVPFFLAGALKILYDLLLYKEFVGIQPVEERSEA